jgi:hypothetical protein
MYSARQRELRERRVRASQEERYWLGETVAAIEIEEGLDFEAPTSWEVRLSGRASAA